MQLGELCSQLETLGRAGQVTEAAARLPDLERLSQATRQALAEAKKSRPDG